MDGSSELLRQSPGLAHVSTLPSQGSYPSYPGTGCKEKQLVQLATPNAGSLCSPAGLWTQCPDPPAMERTLSSSLPRHKLTVRNLPWIVAVAPAPRKGFLAFSQLQTGILDFSKKDNQDSRKPCFHIFQNPHQSAVSPRGAKGVCSSSLELASG